MYLMVVTDPLELPNQPHAQPAEAVVNSLASEPDRGLCPDEVERRRAQYGPNEFAEAPPVARWKKFLGQFTELVIGILIVAALISGLLGEWTDALAILAIFLLNG